MAGGSLLKIDSGSGSGLFVRASHTSRMMLGVGLDASKRGVVTLSTGVEGNYKVSKALLELGMAVPRGLRLPLRMKIVLDGSTVAREFKPQFVEEGDEFVYAKAVYDVKPIAGAKLASKPRHKLIVIYDSSRIVSLDEVNLAVVYDVPGAWHSYTILSGVMTVRPGEEVIVNVKLPETRVKLKNLYVNLVVPSRFSDIEVRAGSTIRQVSGTRGPILVEAPVRADGDSMRVSINYRGLAGSVRPRILYITGVTISETIIPRASLKIEDVAVEAGRSGEKARVRVKIANRGEATPDKAMVVVLAMGIPIARKNFDAVEPGGSVEVEVDADMAKLPAPTNRVNVRVVWSNYGKVYVDEVEARL